MLLIFLGGLLAYLEIMIYYANMNEKNEKVIEPVVMENIPTEHKTWGMIAHLSAFAIFLPFGNILGPLIIWLIKKDTIPFVNDQGKEVLNFNISILLYGIISGLLTFVFVGFLLLLAVFIFWLIYTIKGAMAADKGIRFRYPLTIRLIK